MKFFGERSGRQPEIPTESEHGEPNRVTQFMRQERDNFLAILEELKDKSPKFIGRAKKLLKLSLASLTIFLVSEGVLPNEAAGAQEHQDNYSDQRVDFGGEQERMESLKQKFIGVIKKIQDAGLLKYNGGEGRGVEEASNAKVGNYKVEVLFHHYNYGQKEGEFTGGDNENTTVSFVDESGTEYSIEYRFGKFSGYALNSGPADGLSQKDRQFFFEKGIILGGRNTESAYYKDLSPEEIEGVLERLEGQADPFGILAELREKIEGLPTEGSGNGDLTAEELSALERMPGGGVPDSGKDMNIVYPVGPEYPEDRIKRGDYTNAWTGEHGGGHTGGNQQ